MKQAKTPTAPESGTLYPELPLAGHSKLTEAPRDQSYRLQEISQLKKRLEDDRDKRAELYKKYHRGVNALDGIDTALFTACMGMGMGGVGLLSTIIAAPVVLGLEIAALMCGALGMAGKFVSRRLAVKAKKHDQLRVLAESKLNTIADLVSTALVDGEISDDEFRLVVAEIEKYHQLKHEIRTRAGKAHAGVLDEKTKTSLIQQGRDQARKSFIKKLSGQ
jgi:hypothetical protein